MSPVQRLKLYSPSFVLVAWATWWEVFGRTLKVDVLFLVALIVATVLHTHEEIRRRRNGRQKGQP